MRILRVFNTTKRMKFGMRTGMLINLTYIRKEFSVDYGYGNLVTLRP